MAVSSTPPVFGANKVYLCGRNERSDHQISRELGKIVILKAKLANPTHDSIVLRGDKGILNNWQTNLNSDAGISDPARRQFAFLVRPEEMNGMLSFALVQLDKSLQSNF